MYVLPAVFCGPAALLSGAITELSGASSLLWCGASVIVVGSQVGGLVLLLLSWGVSGAGPRPTAELSPLTVLSYVFDSTVTF